jgi:transcriptional regulatory protein LevR
MLIEELNQRTDILYGGEVISEKVSNYVKEVSTYFVEKDFQDEKVITFITHLAMMMQRVLDGEIEEAMNNELIQQIELSEGYSKAKLYLNKLIELSDIEIPDEEIGYLKLHLCNLINK